MTKQAAQLAGVLCPVVEADDRAYGEIVAEEHSAEDEAYVHEYAVGSHAVLAQQTHQLQVVADAHDVEGDVADVFREAVGASTADDIPHVGHLRQEVEAETAVVASR